MPEEIRIWNIQAGKKLEEIQKFKLNLEQHLVDKGVGEKYRRFRSEMDKYFYRHTTTSSVAFTGNFNGTQKVIFSFILAKRNPEDGLHFQIYSERFVKHFGFDEETALSLLTERKKPWKYYEAADSHFSGFAEFFGNLEEVDKFTNGLKTTQPK